MTLPPARDYDCAIANAVSKLHKITFAVRLALSEQASDSLFKDHARGGRLRQNPKLSASARRFEPPFARSRPNYPQGSRVAGERKT